MTLQAEGSYDKAKALIESLGVVRPPVQKVLDRLTGVPVDIEPTFTTAATTSSARLFTNTCSPSPHDVHRQIRPVADEAVHPPVEQPRDLRGFGRPSTRAPATRPGAHAR